MKEVEQNSNLNFKVPCHENFEARADTIIYDICLVQLTEKISFNENVKPVCLPENDIPPSPGTNCIVAGWGETENTGDNSILQKAIIPIVDAKRCQAFYDEEGKSNFRWLGGYFYLQATFRVTKMLQLLNIR